MLLSLSELDKKYESISESFDLKRDPANQLKNVSNSTVLDLHILSRNIQTLLENDPASLPKWIDSSAKIFKIKE